MRKDALMSNTLEPGEAIHDPGPLAKAMLYDLGWPKPPPAPVLARLPGRLLKVNTCRDNATDLWNYVSDEDTPTAQLVFSIANEPPAELGIELDSNRYIDISPQADWTGQGTVVIEATDPTGMSDSGSFRVTVAAELYSVFCPSVQKCADQ